MSDIRIPQQRTEKQKEAARRNGSKSRGPRSARKSPNTSDATPTSDLLAASILLDGESRYRFDSLLRSLTTELLPATPIEHALVAKMASAHWRQMRAWQVETASLSALCSPSVHPAALLTDPARHLASSSRITDRCDRQFCQALEHFLSLRHGGESAIASTKKILNEENSPTC